MKIVAVLIALFSVHGVVAAQSISMTQKVWNEFSVGKKIEIQEKYKVDIYPNESVGVIVAAQLINRSTEAETGGAVLGSLVGQAAYLSGNNYSASSHLGAGILGALIGSSFDEDAVRKFLISYSVKTLDGQIRQITKEVKSEVMRPSGQCVNFPSLDLVESSLCESTVDSVVEKLNAMANASSDQNIVGEHSGVIVKCGLPSQGVMMIEKNVCLQMNGVIEK